MSTYEILMERLILLQKARQEEASVIEWKTRIVDAIDRDIERVKATLPRYRQLGRGEIDGTLKAAQAKVGGAI